MRATLKAAAAAAVTAVLLAACGSSETPAPGATGEAAPDNVKVGVIPIVDVAPIYLGIEKGFFADRGIELTTESGQGGAAIVPGRRQRPVPVRLQQHDLAAPRPDQGRAAQGRRRGQRVHRRGRQGLRERPREDGQPHQVRQGPRRQEGRRQHAEEHRRHDDPRVVRKAGGDPTGVKFVELPFPDMPAALEEGRVDAVWVVEPFVTIAKDQGARIIASNFVDTSPDTADRGVLHDRAAPAAEPRPGQAVHRGDERVAGVRRGAPGRGSCGPRQLHEDRQGRRGQARAAEVARRRSTRPAWSCSPTSAAEEKLTDSKLDIAQLLP